MRASLLVIVVLIAMGILPAHTLQENIPYMQFVSYEMQVRDTICFVETRSIKNPFDAVSTKGALGPCQVTPATARTVGYRGTNAELLTNALTNYNVALKVVLNCMSYGYFTPYRIAYCYHGGPNRRVRKGNKSHKYAMDVSMMFYQRVLIPRMVKERNEQ